MHGAPSARRPATLHPANSMLARNRAAEPLCEVEDLLAGSPGPHELVLATVIDEEGGVEVPVASMAPTAGFQCVSASDRDGLPDRLRKTFEGNDDVLAGFSAPVLRSRRSIPPPANARDRRWPGVRSVRKRRVPGRPARRGPRPAAARPHARIRLRRLGRETPRLPEQGLRGRGWPPRVRRRRGIRAPRPRAHCRARFRSRRNRTGCRGRTRQPEARPRAPEGGAATPPSLCPGSPPSRPRGR